MAGSGEAQLQGFLCIAHAGRKALLCASLHELIKLPAVHFIDCDQHYPADIYPRQLGWAAAKSHHGVLSLQPERCSYCYRRRGGGEQGAAGSRELLRSALSNNKSSALPLFASLLQSCSFSPALIFVSVRIIDFGFRYSGTGLHSKGNCTRKLGGKLLSNNFIMKM